MKDTMLNLTVIPAYAGANGCEAHDILYRFWID